MRVLLALTVFVPLAIAQQKLSPNQLSSIDFNAFSSTSPIKHGYGHPSSWITPVGTNPCEEGHLALAKWGASTVLYSCVFDALAGARWAPVGGFAPVVIGGWGLESILFASELTIAVDEKLFAPYKHTEAILDLPPIPARGCIDFRYDPGWGSLYPAALTRWINPAVVWPPQPPNTIGQFHVEGAEIVLRVCSFSDSIIDPAPALFKFTATVIK